MNIDKKILLSGYYGFDNSGDDAILKAIVKDIKEKNSNIKITVLSKNPESTKKTYKVNAVDRFKIKEVIKAIRSHDLLISGGGSLLQDVTSNRSLWYYLFLMYLAKIYKKKIMVYANGIGPIDKKFNRYLTRKVLERVDLITLRDEDSLNYIKDMKVENKNITVTADPVFTLDSSKKSRVLEIFKDEEIPLEGRYIGISVRKWKNAQNLEKVVSKAIDYILEKYGVNVILIPMHHPEDLEISLEIESRVKGKNCYTIKNKYNVEDIMGIIRELDLIVAMRLHSLIYAATQEIPMVGIVYDPKVRGILNSFNIEYMSSVESLNLKDLIYNIDRAWENREKTKESLIEQDEKFKEKALSNITMALELLELGD